MPLYEYACRDCEARFEVLQRMGADSAGLVCPKCGGAEVARQLSTFASATGGSAKTAPCGAPSASACGSGGFS